MEDRVHTHYPSMAMLQYVTRCGARPVGCQAGAAPGPQPQRDPTKVTGSQNAQRMKTNGKFYDFLTDGTSVNQDASIVFGQWNAEGIQKKKQVLQVFLKRHDVDVFCVQETHLTEAHKFFIRGYQVFRHDRANRHKGGLITMIKNSIPAVQLSQSDSEHPEFLAVRIILQDGEMMVVNCYGPPDKELKLHSIPTQENKL